MSKIAMPGKHHGGIKNLWIGLYEDINNIPAHDDLMISGDIAMKSGKVFYEIEATYNSISFTENLMRDQNGVFWDQRIAFSVSKSELVKELNWIGSSRRIVVLYKSNNEDYRVIGSIINPAQLTYGLTKSGGFTGQDQYSVTITARSILPALYYQGFIPDRVRLNTPNIYGSTGFSNYVTLNIIAFPVGGTYGGTQIEYKVSSSDTWLTGPLMPEPLAVVDVEGLTGATSYDFRAYNIGAGEFASSPYSNIRTQSTA